ncbi:MAG: hypothetical protein QXD42_06855 [Nitrososphaerales archaeon]
MVEILDSIDDLREHAKYCKVILYRIDEVVNGYRVRLRAGSYAWDGIVKKEEFDKILAWLKQENAKKVKSSVSDELFFS